MYCLVQLGVSRGSLHGERPSTSVFELDNGMMGWASPVRDRNDVNAKLWVPKDGSKFGNEGLLLVDVNLSFPAMASKRESVGTLGQAVGCPTEPLPVSRLSHKRQSRETPAHRPLK